MEHLGDSDTIRWMARSGCRYISISPESGSPRVLKLMQKPFDHSFALKIVKDMFKYKIKSQACFVLGFPGETAIDLEQTFSYIKKLVIAGIDEIALFIMTPIPGTSTFGKLLGYKSYSQMTFSPSWRRDYKKISKIRARMYLLFFCWRMLYHPVMLLIQVRNILLKKFETKSEMVAYRTLKNLWLEVKSRFVFSYGQ